MSDESHTRQTPADRVDGGPPNFVYDMIDEDLRANKHGGKVATRFPPEPNGYLHIGHAKSICLNFGAAARVPGATCNLRFDDTNPAAEDVEFVEAIQKDVRWLGFDWQERMYFASDYFERLYDYAVQLIRAGKAYVDTQDPVAIRESRGNFYKLGTDSPDRNRGVAENLELFQQMRAGAFEEGACVLRAKIDMASPNLNLRDPPIYRIRKTPHHRTGNAWCVYPMYDFAHGLCDAIEHITHSICTLEFENHRPLYDWFLEQLELPHRPQQIEFARLNLGYTVLSKRRLQLLVEQKKVSGWDDPRMPTLAGMRRRGYTPEAIRAFCERIGVARRDGVVDVALLEHALREDLNERAARYMAVLKPLKLVIENYPADAEENFTALNHPEHPERGARGIPFCRELYIEQDDFKEDAPKKWFRLAPGAEVRLRYACLVTCREVVKNSAGEVIELRCTWDPESRGGTPADGRKVKGTLHWVSARHSVKADVHLYDRLFLAENPMQDTAEAADFLSHLNPNSREVLSECRLEPALATLPPAQAVQFERLGYFCRDSGELGAPLVFNRTLTLRDSWAKVEKADG